MSLLEKIDRFSFVQLTILSLILALLIILPATVFLARQQTQLSSQAALETPTTPTPVIWGPLPSKPPKIESVFPFLGKPGDSFLVKGKNFGQNPQQKKAFLGSTPLGTTEIIQWEDEELELSIPPGAHSGFLKIKVGNKEAVWDKPIIVYYSTTPTAVKKEKDTLTVVNVQNLAMVRIWWQSETTSTEIKFTPPLQTGENPAVLAPLSSTPIVSLALYNSNGQILPFFVNPIEFGF